MPLNHQAVIELATRAHAGQRDKLGRDYTDGHLTPIADAAATFGPTTQQAAWLHDTLEDTELTAQDLLAANVDPNVVAAVESVTRIPGEKYTELIQRAAAHPIGRHVKLIDNAWNITLNPDLSEIDPAKAKSMLTRRYLPARQQLLHACQLTENAPQIQTIQHILNKHRNRLHTT